MEKKNPPKGNKHSVIKYKTVKGIWLRGKFIRGSLVYQNLDHKLFYYRIYAYQPHASFDNEIWIVCTMYDPSQRLKKKTKQSVF